MYLPKIRRRCQKISAFFNTVLVLSTFLSITPHILTYYTYLSYICLPLSTFIQIQSQTTKTEIFTASFLLDDVPNTSSYSEILKSGLSVMHLNIQSLRTKLTILDAEIQQYDIVVLTETWLNQSIQNTELILSNFQPSFRRDRKDRIGGGVAIYVHEGIHAKERTEFNVNGTESLWIELVFGVVFFLVAYTAHQTQIMTNSC